MEKIGIVTCSTSGLDFLEGYEEIRKARTTIIMDGKEYYDGLDITPEEFYNQLDQLESIPSTAQPSPGQLLDIYEEMKNNGYTDIIYISISAQLSGTYQGVCLSKTYVEDLNIHPFDSKSASFLTGFMAITALELVKEGKSVDDILDELNLIRENDRIFFMVDDLKYLVKNGRLSNASAVVATMLQIKPLLEIGDEGNIVAKEKIRTTKKAMNRVIDSYLEDTNNGKNSRFTFLFNTMAPDKVNYLKSRLSDAGIDTSTLIDAPISPAIGCHIGKGVIGLAYVKKSAD